MSRTKKAHQLIDQAAGQANALVDVAAEQASTLVDQMAPHLEAAREKVVTEYVPQAREAGRKARKQVVTEYVPQARSALEDARGTAAQAVTAAAARTPLKKEKPKRRGRTVLTLLVLAGVGAAIGSRLRNRNLSPAAMYEAPEPTTTVPPQPNPPLETNAEAGAEVDPEVDPVPPGAVGEHHPEAEDIARLEGEAPVTPATTSEPPTDSLNSFFDEMMDESGKGSRRR